jgi:hypothetical protein
MKDKGRNKKIDDPWLRQPPITNPYFVENTLQNKPQENSIHESIRGEKTYML